MKCSFLALVMIVGAIALGFNEPTFANDNSVDPAANLVTEPATINSQWNNTIKPHANFTLEVGNQECQKINPLEYINHPETFLQKCPATNNQKRENGDPVEYLSVPRLDSGLKLTVTKF